MVVELQAGRLPAAESVTTVQSGVSTFVCVKSHHIFNETLGKFPDIFLCALYQNRYFKPKHSQSSKSKCCLWPNLT